MSRTTTAWSHLRAAKCNPLHLVFHMWSETTKLVHSTALKVLEHMCEFALLSLNHILSQGRILRPQGSSRAIAGRVQREGEAHPTEFGE